jgi:hypothetical protein
MFKREYVVQLTVTSSHEYSVDASSEEEAVALAEECFEAGDGGLLVAYEIETADGFEAGEAEEEDFD